MINLERGEANLARDDTPVKWGADDYFPGVQSQQHQEELLEYS